MCVAIYKPANIAAPSIKTLKQCWDTNPDGAGLAWRTPDAKYPLHIEKGFMTWKEFENYWNSTKMASYTGDLFIHFRITTHGGTSEGNTHPFPISEHESILKSMSTSCRYVMMHNGMLPVVPDNATISDTMMLSKLIARCGKDTDIDATADLLSELIGTNKLAFMDADKVRLVGAWHDVDGVKYSNLHWDWSEYTSLMGGWSDYYKKHNRRCYDYTVFDKADYYNIKATKEEMDYLQGGICPYCEMEVFAHDDCFVCESCGTLYTDPDKASTSGCDTAVYGDAF